LVERLAEGRANSKFHFRSWPQVAVTKPPLVMEETVIPPR